MKKLIVLLSILGFISCSENDMNDPTTLDVNLTPLENLSNGVPVKSIVDSFGVSSLYGLEYGGGHIFHIDASDWSIYIASDYAIQGEMSWGDHFDITNGMAIGDGAKNTREIVEENRKDNSNVPNGFEFGRDDYAFKFVDDLEYNTYSDWFIPSKEAAQKIYDVLYKEFSIPFVLDVFYWTSSKQGYEPFVMSFNASFRGEPFLGTCFASNHLLLVRKIEPES